MGHIDQLMNLTQYRESRQAIFRTKGSMEWYLRNNKNALVTAGALLLIHGTWFVDEFKFDEQVIASGKNDAAAWLARSHGSPRL